MKHNESQKIRGKNPNYGTIEKKEKSEYITNLTKVKEELLEHNPNSAIYYFSAIYYLAKAGETVLVLRLYNEVLPKICIDNIKQCLEILKEGVAPSQENFKEFEDIFYHKVAKMSLLIEDGGQKPQTLFYILISKFCADMYALLEDYRTLGYLKFIDDEKRRKQIEQSADKEFAMEENSRTSDNEESWKQYKKEKLERLMSIERIKKYRHIIKEFLNKVENMKENKTNPHEVLKEITQEVVGKIKLEK